MNNNSPLRTKVDVKKYSDIRESEQYLEQRMKFLSAGSDQRERSPSFENVRVENAKPLKPKSPERREGPSEQKMYSSLRQKASENKGGYTKYPERKKDILISTQSNQEMYDKQITKANSVMSRAKTLRPELQESRTVRAQDQPSLTPYREIYKSFYSNVSAQELVPKVSKKYSKISPKKTLTATSFKLGASNTS